MIRLAANLTMMFKELPFLDRIDAAADAGFTGIEFISPFDERIETIAARVRARGLQVVLFNFPVGNWSAGERGIGALPDRVQEFRTGVDRALEYATALACSRLHLMPGKLPPHADRAIYAATFRENVIYAAEHCAPHGIEVMLEPINTRVDMPHYFLDSTTAACALIDEIVMSNVRLQYDIYHMQIMEGDLARSIERLLPRIGHMQLADNPGRGEPGSGEINYSWLLSRIDSIGYAGWIGCEYAPRGETLAGLGWAAPYLTASNTKKR